MRSVLLPLKRLVCHYTQICVINSSIYAAIPRDDASIQSHLRPATRFCQHFEAHWTVIHERLIGVLVAGEAERGKIYDVRMAVERRCVRQPRRCSSLS